jgi:O-methyltransferase involved in polyketide biosynthesis
VWARHGLSHPALDTAEGRLMHSLLAAPLLAGRVLGVPSLDESLLARHTAIDAVLEEAIADGRVGQVVELACGMSPRGWRFTERHPDLVYVETDLPAMAARKRAALERIGRPPGHRVTELDAMAPTGPRSLAAVVEPLDRGAGLAIVTEGLLSYRPRAAVLDLWTRFAETLGEFSTGVYTADLHVDSDAPVLAARAFAGVLSMFVRGRVAVHFADAARAEAALRAAGFAHAEVRPASDLVRVVEARA